MFTDRLTFALTLRTSSAQHVVAGARIKACTLELTAHGFAGSVTFWNELAVADPLLSWFVGNDLVEVELTVEPSGVPATDAATARIVLHGLCADKSLLEVASDALDGAPVLVREYTVEFVDPAALLWRQQHPLALSADSSIADVLAAQLAGGVTLDVSIDDAAAARPLVCLPLGDGEASFYDFILWYADRSAGCLQYDYWAHGYRLAPQRQSHPATAKLGPKDVTALRVALSATIRHGARVLNGHSEAAQTATVTQPHAVSGVMRDRLVRTSSAADVDGYKQLESQRLRAAEPEVTIDLARYPLVALMPGAQAALEKEQFSGAILPSGKSFRVAALTLTATVSDGAHAERGGGLDRSYATELRLVWESDADQRPRLGTYRPPAWPIQVEGKIVSTIGGEHDRTFMADDDAKSGRSFYSVHVPLWNQTIKVPFGPQFLPGHFFAPAFKDSRVLLDLYFDRAEIAQFLDWGADVRLPGDSQGNHLLFGKSASSQTSLKHAYVDDKAVLSLARVQDGDHGRLQLEEGTLVLEVREDAGAQSGGETHDLTARVAASNAQLASGAQSSIGQIQASASQGRSQLDGKLSGARANLSSSLESLDGELATKSAAARAQLQGSADAVAAQAAVLRGNVDAARAELQSRRGGT